MKAKQHIFLRYTFLYLECCPEWGQNEINLAGKGPSLKIILWPYHQLICLWKMQLSVSNRFSYSSFLPAKMSRTAFRDDLLFVWLRFTVASCYRLSQSLSDSVCVSLSAVHAGIAVLVLYLGVELLWLSSLQRCLWCQEKGERMFESGSMSSTANAYIFCLHFWLETESERGSVQWAYMHTN